jgi:hypothetical protein
MPYCAPSVKGTQCQAYSCEPSRRGSGLPPQPGISSLVLRGASRGSNKRYLIVCISTCHWINSESTASSGPEVITSLRNKGSGFARPAARLRLWCGKSAGLQVIGKQLRSFVRLRIFPCAGSY